VGFLHEGIARLDGIRHEAKEKAAAAASDSESLRHEQAQHLLMVFISHMDQLMGILTILQVEIPSPPSKDAKKLQKQYGFYSHSAMLSVTESERDYYLSRAATTKEHLRIVMASVQPEPQHNSAAIATTDGTVKELPASGVGDAHGQFYASTIWGLERRAGRWSLDVGGIASSFGRATKEGYVLGHGAAKIASVVQSMKDAKTTSTTDPSAGMDQGPVLSESRRNTPTKRPLSPPPPFSPKRRKLPDSASIPGGEELVGSHASGLQSQLPPLPPQEKANSDGALSPTSVDDGFWWREACEILMEYCEKNPNPMADPEALSNLIMLLEDIYVVGLVWWENNNVYQRVGLSAIRSDENSALALQRLRRERDELRPKFDAILEEVHTYNRRPVTKTKQQLGAEIRDLGGKLKVLYPKIGSLAIVTGEEEVDPDENLGFERFPDAMEAANALIDTGELIDIIEQFGKKAMMGYIMEEGVTLIPATASEPSSISRWAIV
jgi:hypothetical protein